MRSHPLTVDVPDDLLSRLEARARKAKRSVEAEVVDLLSAAVNGAHPSTKKPPSRPTSKQKDVRSSDDEELPPDIAAEIARIEQLDEKSLREKAKEVLSTKEVRRLETLNRKAQNEGLTAAEEKERDELSQRYEKAMVVR